MGPLCPGFYHPTIAGDPTWAPEPSHRGAHDPRIDEFSNFKGRVHHTLTHSPGISNIAQHKHAIKLNPLILRSQALGRISNPDSQLSTSLGDLKRLILIPSSLIHMPLTLVLTWPKVLLVKEL